MFINNILDITWRNAENSTVWDTTGKSYTDFTCGIFATNIGHNNRFVTEAIKKHASMIHTYTFQTEIREEYIEELCSFTGFEDAALFSSGTEATEAAWKIARQYSGKWGVIGMIEAFHGKTFGSLIMASRIPSQYYSPMLDKTGMIIWEPYTAPTAKFHEKKKIDRIRGLVLDGKLINVVDEIQSGFGRTGKLFGYQHYDYVQPDMVCIGKGMGNGFPISGVLGPRKFISEPVMDLSSTHGGNPLGCAAGLAVIKFMRKHKIIKEAERKGKILQNTIADFPVITHGKGMVAALVMQSKEAADRVVVDAADMGLLVVHTGKRTVKIAPPLTIPDVQLNMGLEILRRVVGKIEGGE